MTHMARAIFAALVTAVILIPAFALLAPRPLHATLGEPPRAWQKTKVVFVLLDNITWTDIAQANDPFFNSLIEESSIALLNNRTFGRPSRPREALTVGSGVRANASSKSLNALNATEVCEGVPAADAHFLRTGAKVREHNIVELGISSAIADNERIHQEMIPGALGQALRDNGIVTAALGNSDTSLKYGFDYNNREIAAIAMDARGIIDYGNVGKGLLEKYPTAPFGIRTSNDLLLREFAEIFRKANFIAVDYGDTTRADLYTPYVMEDRLVDVRSDAIKRAGDFLQGAMEAAGEDTVFVIASLSPPGSHKSPIGGKLEQLTPVIINGPGFEPGLLTSPTTKRAGLIATTDLTVTILDIFGLKPHYSMVGSVIEVEKGVPDPQQLIAFNDSAVGIKGGRRVAVLTFIYLQLAIYLAAAFLLLKKGSNGRNYIRPLEVLILMAMGFPLLSFFASKIDVLAVNGAFLTAATVAASLLLALALGTVRKYKFVPLAVICGATMLVLVIDLFFGASLQLNTIFGYDPIRGSRFFGIGNEAMSILLATSLLMVGVVLEKARGLTAVALGALITIAAILVDGYPALGADVGGIIAFVAAFATLWLNYKGVRINARNAAVTLGAIAAALAVFVAVDVAGGGATHMGRTIQLIADGGASQMGAIIARKLSTNVMVLRYSTWSYFLLVILLLMVSLSYRPVGLLKKIVGEHRGLAASIMGIAVGAVVGFAVNDSGILIPAIIMSYVFPFVVYLMLWERYQTS